MYIFDAHGDAQTFDEENERYEKDECYEAGNVSRHEEKRRKYKHR